MPMFFGKFKKQLAEKDREIALLREQLVKPVEAEDIVWIFGAGRTGSTWLSQMMGEPEGHQVWFEPQLGELFDPERLGIGTRKGQDFVFAPRYRKVWLGSVRGFVLDGAAARFPEGARVLVIKEPHGSAGAPLLVEALPESRVILLVRDPRDAIASALDAAERGMWRGDVWRGMYGGGRPEEQSDAFVKRAARSYFRHMSGAKRAYEAHVGRKALVRYEELVADALRTMRRVYSELEVSVSEEVLRRAVNEHAWENVPDEDKGDGKFFRRATPGGWREDLTLEQVEVVERITAPLLEQLYP